MTAKGEAAAVRNRTKWWPFYAWAPATATSCWSSHDCGLTSPWPARSVLYVCEYEPKATGETAEKQLEEELICERYGDAEFLRIVKLYVL